MTRTVLPRTFDIDRILKDQERRIKVLEQRMHRLGGDTVGLFQAKSVNVQNAPGTTASCRYLRLGDLVVANFSATLGGAVTGEMRVDLPTDSSDFGTNLLPVGLFVAQVAVASGLNVFKGNAMLHADDYVRIVEQGTGAGGTWNATAPFTWAAGDRLRGMIVYEGVS